MSDETPEANAHTPMVYAAISAVQRELVKTGIAKNRRNEQQGYMFRGIDAVYAALSPLLVEYNLLMLPRVTERGQVERATKSGTAIFYTTVRVEFDFVHTLDGSKYTVVSYGEGMDSADKSTNKAQSMAYKYAALMSFGIPVEGEPDGEDDADHDREGVAAADRAPPPPPAIAKNARFMGAAQSALQGVEIEAERQKELKKIGSSLIDLVSQEETELGTDNAYKMLELLEPLDQDEQLWLSVFLQKNSRVRSRCKAVLVAAREEARKAKSTEPADSFDTA